MGEHKLPFLIYIRNKNNMFWNNVYGAMQHLKSFVTELPNGELVINATPHNLVFEGEISVPP